MTSAPDIVAELQWRGLLYDATEGARDILRRERITIYNGFDPTADSLHVGHLVPMLALARLQRYGHTPIALAGGGTGMIGDPSGKSEERNLLSAEEVEHNVSRIQKQLASILDFDVQPNTARVVNNAEWLSRLSMMDFLRDVGKQFTVNYMLAKESVKSRLERDEAGISYTEFSYMLLQSYDFLHLFQHENCVMQAGGSDQWGNITAGVQLIRKSLGEQAYGISYPLLLKSDGTKFGKTAAGSVWLDPEKTSPYRFYQFWFNADDDQVIQLLKFFTWLDQDAIEELAHQVASEPERREAQRTLAQEVTRMIHGVGGLARAEQASEVLFGGEIAGLSADEIGDIFADVPSSQVARHRLSGEGAGLADLLAESGVTSSKGAAKRAIKGGGIYVNNVRAAGAGQKVTLEDAIEGRFVVLRQGKRKYHLIRLQA